MSNVALTPPPAVERYRANRQAEIGLIAASIIYGVGCLLRVSVT